MFPIQLNILTLNVWGIPFVSSDREARIAAIGDELNSGQYDIVSMQEVWSEKDYQTLKDKTEATLPFSHYFYSGVIGAGLLVLSKYPIIGTLFHAWSVNGYFHRIQHADWFGGKGVGLCRILVGDQIVHLYNAHLHAEYDNENDEYRTHRVIQAFDTAQFIEATRGDSVIQILAGDLNTKPDDITYKVLLYSSRMRDSCTSSETATHECKRNSYTTSRMLSRNSAGIRIDHIFLRTSDKINALITDYKLPFPERVPGQKFSFSDHEAVMAILKITKNTDPMMKIGDSSEMSSCQAGSGSAGGEISCGDLKDNVIHSNYCSSLNTHHCQNNIAVVNEHDISIVNRIEALKESINLCDAALQQLKVDRILYYSVAGFLVIFLILMVEYTVPRGFKTIYLLLKFVVFGIVLFCIFMGSIWNYMERNGILSGKTSMQIMLLNIEKYEL